MSFGLVTPFEYFRTPIFIRRFTQGFYLNGIWQEGSQVSMSSLLIAGNVITMSLNGVVLTPVAFSVNARTTLELLASEILGQPNIQQVDISNDNLLLTIVPLAPNLSVIDSFYIVGGVSQPIVTITNSPTVIAATASVQPVGRDIALVPEGRRDKAEFTFFSSTQIYGVEQVYPDATVQNPDQITVLKAPFTGIVFEVINISEWENNSNFDITNHYKYVALRLHPLPGVG